MNSKVNSLNLQGNDIGIVGISYLQKMINETYTIAELVRTVRLSNLNWRVGEQSQIFQGIMKQGLKHVLIVGVGVHTYYAVFLCFKLSN